VKIRNAAKGLVVDARGVLLQECLIDGAQRFLLPGGGQKRGETLSETVRREVLEETGVAVEVGGLRWVREYIPARHGDSSPTAQHRVEFIFDCKPTREASVDGLRPDAAQLGFGWIPLAEIARLPMWPETIQRLLLVEPLEGDRTTYLGECP
jgi:8-oxo-dGTP pyrophosphatase MutT (NUDIX family)